MEAATPATAPVLVMTATDGPGGTEIIRDVEIAKVGRGDPLLVDIARPKIAPKTPMPAILCVHGGGWTGGSKSLRLDLAQRGYFVVAVAYWLAGKDLWPAQIQDCKLAVRWIRANAAKYDVDPAKIGCFGHSAGGHLVACLGTMHDPALDVGPYPGVSSAVQAVVDYAGPSDLAIYFHHKPSRALFGPDAPPELMDAASPLRFVSRDCPPFFIAHGDKDKAVPLEQGAALAAALKAADVPVEYIVVKDGGHSLGGLKTDPPCQPTSAQLREMSAAFFDKYLKQ